MGSIVKTNLYDAALSSLANQASNWLNNKIIPTPQGSLHPNIAPYGEVFITSDDKDVLLAIGTDLQFNALCEVIDIPVVCTDFDFSTNDLRLINRVQLKLILQMAISKVNCLQFLTACERYKIPAGKINRIDEVFDNPDAQRMILNQTEFDNSISKRVATVAFDIVINVKE